MAIKVPQNEETSGGEKSLGRKESVLLSVEEQQIRERKRFEKRAKRSFLVRCKPLHGRSRSQAKRERERE